MMMGFGFLGMLLFWGVLLLLVGGAILVLRQTAGVRSLGEERRAAARQILDERLARGEINREEYDAVRAQLER